MSILLVILLFGLLQGSLEGQWWSVGRKHDHNLSVDTACSQRRVITHAAPETHGERWRVAPHYVKLRWESGVPEVTRLLWPLLGSGQFARIANHTPCLISRPGLNLRGKLWGLFLPQTVCFLLRPLAVGSVSSPVFWQMWEAKWSNKLEEDVETVWCYPTNPTLWK